MGFVYILQSETSGRFYVGSTDHLIRRFSEHRRGKVRATHNRGPWTVAYWERYGTLAEARRREYEIKQWKSSKMVRALVEMAVG
jgi:putative endonuclease